MEEIIFLVIAIAVLIMIMAKIGMPISAISRASKLPIWARFKASDSWGASWIDDRRILKVILIKIAQAIIVCVLFFFNFFWFFLKALGNGFVKALESTATKAVKK